MPTGLGDEQLWLSATNDNTGTSNAFNDQSGNGNNGAASGTLVVADTSEGGTYAFDFDGTDDRITVPQANFDFLRETNYFSTSAWVKADSVSGQRTIFGGDLNTANHGIFVANDPGTGGVRSARSYGVNPYAPNTFSSTNITASQWTHVCWVVDNTTSTLYLDGVQIFQETGTFQTSTGSLTDSIFIGCYIFGGTLYSFWDGLQDDIRIYDRALTQAEITHLATSRGIEGPPPVGLGDEKIWLCPSINGSANDISGNGKNGTLQGGLGVTDVAGQDAFDFDGIDDYISLPANIGGSSEDEFSFSYWYKRNGGGDIHLFNMAGDGTNTNNVGISSYWQGGGNADAHQHGARGALSTAIGGWAGAGSMVHICVTSDGTDLKFYADGTLISTNTTATNIDMTYAGRIGSYGSVLGGVEPSNVDDFRIYTRGLTQAEVVHLSEARGIEGPPPVGLGDEKLWLCPSINDSANDISGNGNNGIYNGGMGTVVDTSNGGSLAYDFDGTNDSIVIDNNIEFGGNSVSCWVYSDNIALRFREIECYDKSRSTGNPDLVLQHETAAGQRAFSQVSGTAITPYTVINQSQWYHLCSVFDGTNLSVYIDGTLAASVAYTPIPQSDYMIVGARGTGIEYLDGKMDDIRAYDRALTQAEITHLATSRGIEGGPTFTGLGDEQLWLCPSLDDSANDISGYGNNGTYNGGMATVADTGSGGTRAYDFDGTDDYISFASVVTSQTFSASLWFNADVFVSDDMLIGNNDYNAGQRGWNITSEAQPVFTTYHTATSSASKTNLTSTQSTSLSTWTHVAVSYDDVSKQMSIYVNGVSGGTTTVTGLATLIANLTIGKTTIQCFNGKQDDIRIFDRVLTQAEITHLATSRGIEGPPGTPPVTPDVFFNPFKSKAFHTLIGQRIR